MKRVLYPLALAAGLAVVSLPATAFAGGVKSPWQLTLLESCKSEAFIRKTQAEAAARDVEAMAALGYLQAEGCGVPLNAEESARWLLAAATLGQADAMAALGNRGASGRRLRPRRRFARGAEHQQQSRRQTDLEEVVHVMTPRRSLAPTLVFQRHPVDIGSHALDRRGQLV